MPLDSTRSGLKQAATPADQKTWQVGKQTIIAGDCLGELREFRSASVDIIVTSPPYNIPSGIGPTLINV
jgi:hypothetical protein